MVEARDIVLVCALAGLGYLAWKAYTRPSVTVTVLPIVEEVEKKIEEVKKRVEEVKRHAIQEKLRRIEEEERLYHRAKPRPAIVERVVSPVKPTPPPKPTPVYRILPVSPIEYARRGFTRLPRETQRRIIEHVEEEIGRAVRKMAEQSRTREEFIRGVRRVIEHKIEELHRIGFMVSRQPEEELRRRALELIEEERRRQTPTGMPVIKPLPIPW